MVGSLCDSSWVGGWLRVSGWVVGWLRDWRGGFDCRDAGLGGARRRRELRLCGLGQDFGDAIARGEKFLLDEIVLERENN